MRSEIAVVLFDAVGTLIYADPPVAQVYYEAGKQHGSTLSRSEIKARFVPAMNRHNGAAGTNEERERMRWSRVVADVFSDLDDTTGLFEELWNHFADHHHWSVYDDVAHVWRELEARSLKIGIASNFDQRLHGIASNLPPLDRALSVFVSSQLGYRKPHTTFFRSIEKALHCRPDQLLLVGDDLENDHHGARQAGWQRLLLRREETDCGDRIISSLPEIFQYFGAR